MFSKIKTKIAKTRFVQKRLAEPPDLEIFRQKPSARFFLGLFIIGISYLIGWPLISVLGLLAALFKEPLLFAIGSPVTYGFSHLLFMLGVVIAGKDTVAYLNVFLQWSLAKGLKKLLGAEAVAERPNPKKPGS